MDEGAGVRDVDLRKLISLSSPRYSQLPSSSSSSSSSSPLPYSPATSGSPGTSPRHLEPLYTIDSLEETQNPLFSSSPLSSSAPAPAPAPSSYSPTSGRSPRARPPLVAQEPFRGRARIPTVTLSSSPYATADSSSPRATPPSSPSSPSSSSSSSSLASPSGPSLTTDAASPPPSPSSAPSSPTSPTPSASNAPLSTNHSPNAGTNAGALSSASVRASRAQFPSAEVVASLGLDKEGWLRELRSLRDDEDRIDLLAEILAVAATGEEAHIIIQLAKDRIESALVRKWEATPPKEKRKEKLKKTRSKSKHSKVDLAEGSGSNAGKGEESATNSGTGTENASPEKDPESSEQLSPAEPSPPRKSSHKLRKLRKGSSAPVMEPAMFASASNLHASHNRSNASGLVRSGAPSKGLLSRMFGGGTLSAEKMAQMVQVEETTWRSAFRQLIPAQETLISVHVCSYNRVKGMLYISNLHVAFLERLSEQHASVIKKLWRFKHFLFIKKAPNRSITIITRDGQLSLSKFEAGHQEATLADLQAQFAPFAPRTQSLHQAIDEKDVQTVRILLRDPETARQQMLLTNDRMETPLANALHSNDTEIIRLFLQYYRQAGLNINTVDHQGYTPLHIACLSNCRNEVLDLLLSYDRIQVSVENEDGNTPLHYFCRCFLSPTCQTVLQQLLSFGADPNKQNKSGETPLHKAILNDSVRVLLIECLLDNKADVNIVNKFGESPLHYAVRLGRKDVVSRLLCAGANTELKGSIHMKTPTELAVEARHLDIANHLKRVDELLEWLRAVEAEVLLQPFMAREIFLNELGVMSEADFVTMLELIEANKRLTIPDKRKLIEAWASLKDRKLKELTKAEAMLLAEKLSGRDVARFRKSVDKVIGEARQGSDDTWIIPHPELEFTKFLGDGTSGKVYRGLYRHMDVAIKVLYEKDQRGKPDDDPYRELLEEIKFLSFFEDTADEIVRFYGVCFEPAVCLVMEFCERGSLYGVLKDDKMDLTWEMAISIIQATVRGIHHLHTSNPQVLHRDLKTLNLLVTYDWQIKVADFGLARTNTHDNRSTLNRLCGTLYYCAPELLFGEEPYSTKADIYSLGIVLWEIVTRCLKGQYERPYAEFGRQREVYIVTQVYEFDRRPAIPPECPEIMRNLIQACWSRELSSRPEVKEILEILGGVAEDYYRSPERWEQTRIKRSELIAKVDAHGHDVSPPRGTETKEKKVKS